MDYTQMIERIQDTNIQCGLMTACNSVDNLFDKNCLQLLKLFEPNSIYLILGEATQSVNEYVYNPSNKRQNFLEPQMVTNLLYDPLVNGYHNLLANKGVVIFDLMPLPLPTKYYDEKTFVPTENELTAFWHFRLNALLDILKESDDVSIKICKRYKKIGSMSSRFVQMFKLLIINHSSTINYDPNFTLNYELSDFENPNMKGIPRKQQRAINPDKLKRFLDLDLV